MLAPACGYAQETGVEEVVVTAQRREQSLQDVPIAVTAVTERTLKGAGLTGTGQLQQIVPNLTMTLSNAAVTPFIRGVGTTNAIPGNELAVATYVDGVYLLSAQSTLFSFNNIERIEVLRGPQGTLFGRNATGGLVQVVTKEPSQEPRFQLGATIENYDTQTVQGYVTGGLTDSLAASLAVTAKRQGRGYGFNRNLRTDVDRIDELAGRWDLLYSPTDALKINLSFDFNSQEGDAGITRTGAPGTRTVIGTPALSDPRILNTDQRAIGDLNVWGSSLRAKYDLSDRFTLTNITAYRKMSARIVFDQDLTPLWIAVVDSKQLDSTFQQELFLNGQVGRLNLTTGLFYLRTTSTSRPNTTSSSSIPTINIARYATAFTKSYAAYAQATFAATSRTNLTAGLRFTREDKRVEGTNFGTFGHPVGAGNVIAAASLAQPRSKTFEKITWRLSVDQKLTDDVLLYVSNNRGYKSGGFSVITLTQPELQPEILDSYEAGVKSDWFNGQFRLNLAGYYYDYKNLQVSQIVAGGATIINAAKATAKGVELESEFSPHLEVGRLNLRASVAYAHGEYDDFPAGPVFVANPYAAPPPGVTCPTPSSASPGGNTTCRAQLAGNTLVRMPKWTASFGAEYAMPLAGGELSLSANYYYSGKYFFDPDNLLFENGYSVVNAEVAYAVRDGAVRFRAFGRNLGDGAYYVQGNRGALGDLVTLGRPRTYGVGLDMRF